MKIVIISDTHEQEKHIEIPEGDLLIHCGDFTKKGSYYAIRDFAKWFAEQPHKFKVLIAGNHEMGLEFGAMRETKLDLILDYTKKDSNFHYLENSSVEIEGLKIYGSPITPYFFGWAWNVGRGGEIAERWSQIPDDTNILITHGPPWGILDSVPSDRLIELEERVGCEDLLKRVKQLQNLKLHAFGHIHTGHGIMIQDNVTFVNAAICGDRGHVVEYDPIVIEL